MTARACSDPVSHSFDNAYTHLGAAVSNHHLLLLATKQLHWSMASISSSAAIHCWPWQQESYLAANCPVFFSVPREFYSP